MKSTSKYLVLYTQAGMPYRLIYTPDEQRRPMHVVVFASGSGGNFKAAIDLSLEEPSLIQIGLLVTDRFGIRAIEIAEEHKIPVLSYDFEKECGIWAECKNDPKKAETYKAAAIYFHNRILQQIIAMENKLKYPFDLAVLAYHRWIHGDLLKYFNERMINQHAGDLTVVDNENPNQRKYIGINPVLKALQAGEKKTRTSTFVVREGEDTGEILCQGPWVTYGGSYPVSKSSAFDHELIQKRESDWPSLRFALKGIAQGFFGLAVNDFHQDGCKVVVYKGRPISYGGVEIQEK